MFATLLHPATKKIAFERAYPPSAAELFGHQAETLRRLGLCTIEELAAAEERIPLNAPFVFVPGKASHLGIAELVRYVGVSYGRAAGACRIEQVDHPVSTAGGDGGYFLTDYRDAFNRHENMSESAQEHTTKLLRNRRSPLTAVELAFRLIYFPEALEEYQFGAAGSSCRGGEHTPVFFIPHDGSGVPALDSFDFRHRSGCTLFPSCGERVRMNAPAKE